MKFNDLTITANKAGRRVGRGISAGQGKTAGRGTKGQRSRTGSSRRPGFEGGQTPLMQRIPKLPGFTSHRTKAENVYVAQLNAFSGSVDNFTLFDAGLISSPYVRVKLLAKGEASKKLVVSLQGASKTAIDALQKAGGTFTQVERPQRQKLEKNERTEAQASKKAVSKTTKK